MAQAACSGKLVAFSTHGVTALTTSGTAALHATGAQKAEVKVWEEVLEEAEGGTRVPESGDRANPKERVPERAGVVH